MYVCMHFHTLLKLNDQLHPCLAFFFFPLLLLLQCSPWGQLAKGGRTRNNKRTEALITRKRWRLKLDAYNFQSKKKKRSKAPGAKKKRH